MDKCVIIGAGEIRDYDRIKRLINDGDTIVCADGGYVHAEKMNLNVNCVIGDFDSSLKPDDENTVVLPVEKDVTDTFFCAREYMKKGYTDFLLLGMSGGRFDHTYANLQTLYYLVMNGCHAVIFDEKNKIYALKDNEMIVKYSGYDNISFFALFEEVGNLEIKNAKYQLNGYDLKADDPLCVSNGFVDKQDIIVKKKSGVLLVVESE